MTYLAPVSCPCRDVDIGPTILEDLEQSLQALRKALSFQQGRQATAVAMYQVSIISRMTPIDFCSTSRPIIAITSVHKILTHCKHLFFMFLLHPDDKRRFEG